MPRVPVTTRIITFLVGNPNVNLHFWLRGRSNISNDFRFCQLRDLLALTIMIFFEHGVCSFRNKNTFPENENGWTPSKKKKHGISRNPSWVHLRKSQVKGRPPIVFQVPKTAPAQPWSFRGSKRFSAPRSTPWENLAMHLRVAYWSLLVIMSGSLKKIKSWEVWGDLLGWFFGGCGWFWWLFLWQIPRFSAQFVWEKIC